MPDWKNEECLWVDQSIIASNASSDALGFPVRGCLKQFERKISFSMLSNILKMKKNVMENKNLDQMQSCKRQQRQLEYRYELFKD